MYNSSILRFILACMVVQAALGTTTVTIQQDPPTVSPGSSLSLTCTVNEVSDLCRPMPAPTLEWEIPYYLHHRILYPVPNGGITPFHNFSAQHLNVTSNCVDESLISTLTFVADSEFKNTLFKCAMVIDQTQILSGAIPLNVNTTCSTCPECLNTTSSTCPECQTLPPNTTVTTEPYAVTSITEDNITCTMCQTKCPPHGAASERSASIFSLILLLGLLIIMIVNLL